MVQISSEAYTSERTLIFQRLTVILSESLYFYGCLKLLKQLKIESYHMLIVVFLLPGLLFVDHLHFQYNGFLFGILLLSIQQLFDNQFIFGGIMFATVLNFKHIFMYLAPAFFVYILSAYCHTKDGNFSVLNLIKIGLAVVSVFLVSFGPFYEHIPQIFSRLFPFKRGLCHAYWAPNFWALYSMFDRVLIFILSKWGLHFANISNLTRFSY